MKYSEYEKMINKLVWLYSLRTNNPQQNFNKLKSIANETFCICLRKYDKKRHTKFSSYLYSYINGELKNYVTKRLYKHQHNELSEFTPYHDMTEKKIILQQSMKKLSKNSKRIVNFIFNQNGKDISLQSDKSTNKITMYNLKDHFRFNGMTSYEVDQSFAEIKNMIKGL